MLMSSAVVGAVDRHPFGFEDMAKMMRISAPKASPDGKWIVYSGDLPDLKANKTEKDIWLVSSVGGEPVKLTGSGATDYSAAWLNNNEIVYISVRKGAAQIWKINPFTKAEAQLTKFPIDVDSVDVTPDGNIYFSAAVYPDCKDIACTAARSKEKDGNPVKAYIYDELLFRHWDTWDDGKRNHLFAMPAGGGEPVDITAGLDADAPTKPWGGFEEVSFAPDGSEAAYTTKTAPNPAVHTNNDIFVYKFAAKETKCITCSNKATDTTPAYSPDGKYLAYLAMKLPGYESDRLRIMLYERASGEVKNLTEGWDYSPLSITWGVDSKTLFVTAEEEGRLKIFSVDIETGKAKTIVKDHYNSSLLVSGDRLIFLQDGFTRPAEIYTSALDGSDLKQVTNMNKAVLEQVSFSEPEEFWFKGARGDMVHGWFFKPAGFKEGEKYPLAYFIHGGPQGAFEDHFHYRWNMEMAPGEGFAAATVNFHGSTGYGSKFKESISRDWGGAPFKDLMMGLDHVLAVNPWIDSGRVCALGASYGGYMVNWIEGQTDRFACLVSHDGDFSTMSSYYNTEELWFPEWDVGGTPYDNPRNYEKWSPDRFVKNWKTPMLVIHGAKDYRVVDTEGMSTFTALRRKGVPARFIYFPNANHWVLKPGDSQLWHKEVYGWMKKWTEK